MSLLRHLDRSSKTPAPRVQKAAAVLGLTMVWGPPLQAMLMQPRAPVMAGLLVLVVLELALFVGLWNMKRWAVIGIAALLALMSIASGVTGPLFLLTLFLWLPLAPSIFLWDRMTWAPAPVANPREIARTVGFLIGGVLVTWVALTAIYFAIATLLLPMP
ncbi:Hypothetical protein A7982_11671 [Minicystis rosea]|nr:Hypothetical protein A7982_11671 [Minicystis rosea]